MTRFIGLTGGIGAGKSEALAAAERLGDEVEVAVVEVPLLFEAAMEGAFDATAAVIAADPIREERLAARGQPGLEGRESRQLDQDEKARRADHVIRNDGSLEDLEREVGALLREEGAAR